MHITTISLGPGLGLRIQRALRDLAWRLSQYGGDRLRARQALATARALGRLDDRTLHDLGLGRSELLSASAELHDLAPRERRLARLNRPLPR